MTANKKNKIKIKITQYGMATAIQHYVALEFWSYMFFSWLMLHQKLSSVAPCPQLFLKFERLKSRRLSFFFFFPKCILIKLARSGWPRTDCSKKRSRTQPARVQLTQKESQLRKSLWTFSYRLPQACTCPTLDKLLYEFNWRDKSKCIKCACTSSQKYAIKKKWKSLILPRH